MRMSRALLAALAALAGARSALASAETCDLESVAYLQTRNLQGSHLGVARACDINDIDSGNCGKDECTSCVPSVNGTRIPTNDTNGWEQGFLECKNLPRTLADGPSGSSCLGGSSDGFYIFEDSDDYLICDGFATCIGQPAWNVRNVGAVCCSGYATCITNRIFLNNGSDPENPKGTCSNDLCCDGIVACTNSEFVGVGSISCRGASTCGSSTNFELSGDVWCSSESIVENAAQTGPKTCEGGVFRFIAPDESEHCITCLGTNVCRLAQWYFHANGA